ncbi:MAG: PAS domain S-box protein [bacterium]
MTDKRIMLVEDSAIVLRDLHNSLVNLGYHISSAVTSAEEAIENAYKERPDLIIMDILLGGEMTGIEAAVEIRNHLHIPVIFLSAYDDSKMLDEAKITEPYGYLLKPFSERELHIAIDMALYKVKMEETLRRTQERYKALFDRSSDMVYIHDFKGKFLDANRTTLDLLGYAQKEIRSLNFTSLLTKDQVKKAFKIFREVQNTGRQEKLTEFRLKTKKGAYLYVETVASLIYNDGEPYAIQGIARNITERKQLEKEILEISGREQRRIGQDLHDSLGQILTGIAFLNKALEQKLSAESMAAAADAAEVGKLINEAVAQTRSLARILCPVELNAEGFITALKDLVSNVAEIFNISCTFFYDSSILINDETWAINLYRIAQEAIQNGIRHGNAEHIELHLTAMDDQISLSVKNDGKLLPEGFDKSKGMGIRIMEHRALMIGGCLTINSGADGWTTVTCYLGEAPEPHTSQGS